MSAPLRSSLRPAGPPRLELSRHRLGAAIVLEVQGELDLLTAPRLGTALDELIRMGREDVVVDLRQTRFLDSPGLRVLLGSRRRLRQQSRTLTVVCASGPVRRVIELARLVDTLGVVADLGQYERRMRSARRRA